MAEQRVLVGDVLARAVPQLEPWPELREAMLDLLFIARRGGTCAVERVPEDGLSGPPDAGRRAERLVVDAPPRARAVEGCMSSNLARIRDEREPLALVRLDPYAKSGVAQDGPRVNALATISCGYRAAGQGDRAGLPKASRANDDKQIHLHDPQGRAPGLTRVLQESKHRSLLIAFPLDEPRAFIQQRFTRYSASRLEAYGDAQSLTYIDNRDPKNPQHKQFPAGTDEYARLLKTCKADTRIYFCLAEWTDGDPAVVFPDGLGFYAIRTTSRHSVRSIEATLAYTQQFTRGRLAGLPFVLEIDYREVAGPDGSKRTIPVWTVTTRPPQGIRLSSKTFAGIATKALAEGAALMLPAPEAGTWEDYEAEGPSAVEEPSSEQVERLEAGGFCDAEFYRAAWFARVRDTALDSDEARASFLSSHTDGEYESLSEFFEQANEAEAAALIAAAGDLLTRANQRKRVDEYNQIFGEDEPPKIGGSRPVVVEAAAGSSGADPSPSAPAGDGGSPPPTTSPSAALPPRADLERRWQALLDEAIAYGCPPKESVDIGKATDAQLAHWCDGLKARIDEARGAEEAQEPTKSPESSSTSTEEPRSSTPEDDAGTPTTGPGEPDAVDLDGLKQAYGKMAVRAAELGIAAVKLPRGADLDTVQAAGNELHAQIESAKAQGGLL